VAWHSHLGQSAMQLQEATSTLVVTGAGLAETLEHRLGHVLIQSYA
jgi:hypothetical protein